MFSMRKVALPTSNLMLKRPFAWPMMMPAQTLSAWLFFTRKASGLNERIFVQPFWVVLEFRGRIAQRLVLVGFRRRGDSASLGLFTGPRLRGPTVDFW